MNIDTNTLRKFIAERMVSRSYASDYGIAMSHLESFLSGWEEEGKRIQALYGDDPEIKDHICIGEPPY
jgi:hypothetical protein